MLVRLWSLASCGRKPPNTDEPAGGDVERCGESDRVRLRAVDAELVLAAAKAASEEGRLIWNSRIVGRAEDAVGSGCARDIEARTERRVERVAEVVVEGVEAWL